MHYVDVNDIKVGDVVVTTRPVMMTKVQSTTYATITEVGEVKDHGGRKYKHFNSDMVTDSGHENPGHKFMLPLLSNVRVDDSRMKMRPTGARGCGDCGAPARSFHAGNCDV